MLAGYLADKLDRPVAGLTRPALAAVLAEHGLDPALIERVNTCLAEAELGRFSPEAGHPAHAPNLLTQIDNLIGDLERKLS